MTNLRVEPIYQFRIGKDFSQKIFDDLVETVLRRKYPELPLGTVLPMSPQKVTETILDLTSLDVFNLRGKGVDGEVLKELFAACIYCRFFDLDRQYRNKILLLCLSSRFEPYRIAMFVTDHDACRSVSDDVYELDRMKTLIFNLRLMVEDGDISLDLKKKTRQRSKYGIFYNTQTKSKNSINLDLVFVRESGGFDVGKAQKFLQEKNLELILHPTSEGLANLTAGSTSGRPKDTSLEEYNFLITTESQVTPISFNHPKSFQTL